MGIIIQLHAPTALSLDRELDKSCSRAGSYGETKIRLVPGRPSYGLATVLTIPNGQYTSEIGLAFVDY
jgi:hypothetical protein